MSDLYICNFFCSNFKMVERRKWIVYKHVHVDKRSRMIQFQSSVQCRDLPLQYLTFEIIFVFRDNIKYIMAVETLFCQVDVLVEILITRWGNKRRPTNGVKATYGRNNIKINEHGQTQTIKKLHHLLPCTMQTQSSKKEQKYAKTEERIRQLIYK